MLSPALSPRALSEESKRKIFPLSWLSKNLSMRRWFCEVGVYLHCVSKNDTALACCNFDLHQTILILFGRNVGTVFFISPNYCFCTKQDWRSSASALPGKTRKHENRIFFTQMLYYCFSRVQPVDAWFLQFCWLETHILAGIEFQNVVINWVQLCPIAQEKWSWEFCAAAVEQCCAQHALVHAWAVLLKVTANICWNSKISYQYCPLTFHLRLDKEQLPLWTQRSTSRQTW